MQPILSLPAPLHPDSLTKVVLPEWLYQKPVHVEFTTAHVRATLKSVPSIEEADRFRDMAEAHHMQFVCARIPVDPTRFHESPGPERSLLSGWIDFAMYLGCHTIRLHVEDGIQDEEFTRNHLLPLMAYSVDYEMNAAVFPGTLLDGVSCPTGETSKSGADLRIGDNTLPAEIPIVTEHDRIDTPIPEEKKSSLLSLLESRDDRLIPLVLQPDESGSGLDFRG